MESHFELALGYKKQEDWNGYYKNLIIGANNGDLNSIKLMDQSYANNIGIGNKNWSYKFIEFCFEESNQNNSFAQCHLGIFYENGVTIEDKVIEKNYEKAKEFYSKSIDKNNPVGYNNLGRIHEFGIGIPKSLNKARELYKKSAKFGYSIGMYNFSRLLISYEPKNNKKAQKWLKKACEQNKLIMN